MARVLILVTGHLRASMQAGTGRPSDVAVALLPTRAVQLGEEPPSVVASITNYGNLPVLVGLSVHRRRCPGWLRLGQGTKIVRLMTIACRYRADRQAAIGIIAAGETSLLPVPFAAGPGQYCLVAVIGQSDNRLRLTRLAFTSRAADDIRPSNARIIDLFPWCT